MGVSQTEIDALASLRPDLLRQIATEAVLPFYDATLDRRVWNAYTEWQEEAQGVLDDSMDTELLARIQTEATERLGELRQQIDALTEVN